MGMKDKDIDRFLCRLEDQDDWIEVLLEVYNLGFDDAMRDMDKVRLECILEDNREFLREAAGDMD